MGPFGAKLHATNYLLVYHTKNDVTFHREYW